jgi:peptide/nickel transport system substrate-binding protein
LIVKRNVKGAKNVKILSKQINRKNIKRFGGEMRRKIIWSIISCLLMLSLVLASCGGEEGGVVTEEEVRTPSDVPEYGGTLNVCAGRDVQDFDPWGTRAISPLNVQHDHLFIGDWNVGEDEWASDAIWIPEPYRIPALAESYEVVDTQTIVVKLKKGIKFNSGLPESREIVGDREFTADDVVYTFSRACGLNEGWRGLTGEVSMVEMSVLRYMESVTALDDYTVEFKFSEPDGRMFWSLSCYHATMMIPYEIVVEYGDYNDPLHYVGTGAFYISEFVPGSSFTCLKNPDHWDTSRYYGDKYSIPFVDKVNWMIITDQSTQIAALRTGKLDVVASIPWHQVDSIKTSNPELKWRATKGSGMPIWLHQDYAPFDNILVRQAMSLAIDHVTIRDEYFGGNAAIGTIPYAASWESLGYFTAFDDMPTEQSGLVEGSMCSVKELFSYDTDKAEELLDLAGYPRDPQTGWRIECDVCCQASSTTHTDYLLVIAEYLAEVGIKMDLMAVEDGAYWTHLVQHTFPWLCSHQIGLAGPLYVAGQTYRGEPGAFSVYNHGEVSDWTYDDLYEEVIKTFDYGEQTQKAKELGLYHKEAVLILTPPCPYSYKFWQPWIDHGGYWGQDNMQYGGTGDIWRQIWIDQELKESMGY